MQKVGSKARGSLCGEPQDPTGISLVLSSLLPSSPSMSSLNQPVKSIVGLLLHFSWRLLVIKFILLLVSVYILLDFVIRAVPRSQVCSQKFYPLALHVVLILPGCSLVMVWLVAFYIRSHCLPQRAGCWQASLPNLGFDTKLWVFPLFFNFYSNFAFTLISLSVWLTPPPAGTTASGPGLWGHGETTLGQARVRGWSTSFPPQYLPL